LHNLRAAVAGTGFMGSTHVEALRRLGVGVAGVLGDTPDKGRAASERLGIGRAYDSLDELLTDQAVDVVHICTPNYLHHPLAGAALETGKHVLCEKPLTVNTAQPAELVQMVILSQVRPSCTAPERSAGSRCQLPEE